jgi:hypothetical protein
MKDDIHLAGIGAGMFLGGEGGAIEAVFGERLNNIALGAREFVVGIDFAELKLGRADDLVCAGPVWFPGDTDRADKEIGYGHEGDGDLVGGKVFGFDFNVGKQARVVQGDDAIPDAITVERLAQFLR